MHFRKSTLIRQICQKPHLYFASALPDTPIYWHYTYGSEALNNFKQQLGNRLNLVENIGGSTSAEEDLRQKKLPKNSVLVIEDVQVLGKQRKCMKLY